MVESTTSKTKNVTTTTVKPTAKPAPVEEKKDNQLEQILNMMTIVVQKVESVEQRVVSLEEKPVSNVVSEPVSNVVADSKAPYSKETDETYPNTYVPAKWRKLVDEILTPDFGFTVNDFEDRTDFQINIIVPKEYSSLNKEEIEHGVSDVRSKIISRAMGENGVREWAQKVRFNLNKYFMKEGKASPFK